MSEQVTQAPEPEGFVNGTPTIQTAVRTSGSQDQGSPTPSATNGMSPHNLNSLRPPKYILDTKVTAPCHHVPGRKDGKPCNRCRQNAWEKERRELARSERRRASGSNSAAASHNIPQGSHSIPGGAYSQGGYTGSPSNFPATIPIANKRERGADSGEASQSRRGTRNHHHHESQAGQEAGPNKRARRVPTEERSKELDQAASRVYIVRQDLTPALKKELLRWDNHQFTRKLTTRRLELLQTFEFYFCYGISWEDILESAEAPSTRPPGWEEANAKTLQQVDDKRFFMFVQSQETTAWMQVLAKAEGLVGKDLELMACGASQELALQMCDPQRQDIDDGEDDFAQSVKEGCRGGSFQVGVVLPQGSVRLGHQRLRAPRRYPDMDLTLAADRMLDNAGTEAVLQELSDIYQMFLPTSWTRAQEWKQIAASYVPAPLFLPHLTASWNTNPKCHRDPPNRIQSLTYVHGPFTGGDYAFPALNFRTKALSGTLLWGWTDILEYYVCDWSYQWRPNVKGYRASWMLTLSADIYDEVMSCPAARDSGVKSFFDFDKLFEPNQLFDWDAVYDLTGGTRADLEKVLIR
ncbi:uncharacterized protein EV422DRAFT_519270 [Fimicolochytrium jonesii]|uniref:uncharacterized protein n=1 Tax=Fimicolochytrium jonesii TaxID=1396493 RepID=UPI0022FE4BC2|nr:uncharacterized protein EV422DRAFT_519270 [Fimicolochytrium jonesii]KAI8824201.1 hypothetical protein EV422DRAFT_519270 [Fimicolochytrium jonesii]